MTDSEPQGNDLPCFSQRLNYLWATRLSPRNTPFTLREVHEATGRKLSLSYLSLLRKGGIAAPSGERLQLLADFFGVPVSYFTAAQVPQELSLDDIDPELRKALRNPMVQELALRAAKMSREEWELVLHMMHHAQELVGRIRSAPPPETSPKDAADE
jgi:transcriptional regulator with XRE-family HTH domain